MLSHAILFFIREEIYIWLKNDFHCNILTNNRVLFIFNCAVLSTMGTVYCDVTRIGIKRGNSFAEKNKMSPDARYK
jgi:hypothetical protein